MRRVIVLGAAVAASSVIIAGCGGGGSGSSAETADPAATAPVASAAPVAVAAVGVGGTVTAGPTTPKPVAAALKGSGVVVVSFVVRGVADDDSVASAVAEVRSDPQASRGVAFFQYDVGKDSFGDLADRLGVNGTPAVAVIGRDRTLVNLWSGLIDAEILRQSISDAADTVAAHPGAKAASTPGSPSTGPTGDAKGIALARAVNAAYRDVPGVTVKGSVPVEGAGTMAVDATMAFDKGGMTGMSGSFTLKGASFKVAVSKTSARISSGGAACWAALPGGSFPSSDTPAPTVVFTKARIGAPRTEGGDTLLDVTSGGTTVTYVIDPATQRVTGIRADGGRFAFTVLDSVPSIQDGTPVCDNPADALKGLPSSLGGTS